MSFAALAQSTAINTTEGDYSKSILDKITPDRISHFSIVNGPSLDGNNSPRNFDGTINNDGVNSWHQVSFGYNINKTTRFVVNPRFTLDRSTSNESQAIGNLDNPVLGITSTWFKKGNFTFSGGLNTMFAQLSDSAKERGTEWNPGGFQTANFKINDKLNVGSWIWGRYEFHRNAPDRRRAPLVVSPYLSYSLADKMTFQGFVNVYGKVEDASTLEWSRDEDLNFSVSYQISKNLSLQPIITVFRDTDFDVQEGNLNLWVSGRFL
jgi:hypothetical protein